MYELKPVRTYAQFLHFSELRIGRRKRFAVIGSTNCLSCASPGLSVRGSGFQTRENAPSCNDRALALVSMLRSAAEIPLEKVLQFIKGGFSYRAKQEIHFAFEIWQANFVNHRIRDAEDYKYHHTYIWENPFKAGLNERPELFARSSASLGMELEVPPPGLKP